MNGEVVWSINIMIIILLASVAYVIYWIFMYDKWYPNEQSKDSSIGISSEEVTRETEGTD